MLLLLGCPHCRDAYERETRDYHTPQACADCGALLQMSYDIEPHLVLMCQACGRIFEGREGQKPPFFDKPRCPACGVEPGAVDD